MRPAATPSVRRRDLCSRNRPASSALSRQTICTNSGSCHRPGREPSRSPRSSFHRRAAATHWRVASGASQPSHPAPARSGPLGSPDQESRRESCSQQESLPPALASQFSPTDGIGVYIMHAVEASLKRLRTDWIDLYQLHRPDPDTPMQETLRALDDLVQAGKVRFIGCSNLSAQQVREAQAISWQHGIAPFCPCPSPYNLLYPTS